ncbi:glycosyltransferase family 4 protein [Rhodothermus profundi]|uniref:Glycosyltransferase involved in cell wall bisynthesis n=1 Tax=Rhodothermus profundi TaxID=633813 RepID=A0A1M6SKL9_9BACT|nr:glycosyltransferase family 4 protein [Rhodothermus profundi]SHK45282.1 Glycosyltransferase involved in cell wall bisynthesis [Rhodothermus profundi]
MRRVLIIAYYFPPMGLSGVQRVAKFARYLPHHGWHPLVLTVKPGGYFAYDQTLLAEVEAAGVSIYRTASLDPTRLFRKRRPVPLPSESVRKRWHRLNSWLFVPDNKIGWLPPAVWTGRHLLQQHAVDVIFASAPPATSLLVGALLHRWSGRPLVLDFRDDWLDNPRQLYPTRWHRRLHARLEQWTFRQAACILTINSYLQRALQQRIPAGGPPVHVIPHGFDPADFENVPAEPRSDQKLRLLYSGVFYDAQQPDAFLRALAQWLAQYPEARPYIEAVFVGLVPPHTPALIDQLGLQDIVTLRGYCSHQETIAALKAADVLWLTVGEQPGAAGITTSKLFEYLGTRKPILALIPDGVGREILLEYGAAYLAPPHEVSAIVQTVHRLYEDWRSGRLPVGRVSVVSRYDRQQLAGHLARLLEATLQSAAICTGT